ncbi:glycosyltransferase family 2 protein [Ruminococcaceae bacterium OttesenSCG-928-D13]|nr:glycosyltransferase family 2 protein [Ruminococcaceae bacterium OttesenSCG-928-D13]
MASISVCMIVKDEEAVLARCLDALEGIPDEIIIVDTGSTDATKDVARRYTSKLYDFQWIDDFAAARNFSLSKAAMDYIYVADADEVIDAENLARFKQLKEALLPEVEVVEMAYANKHDFKSTENFEVEYRPKLFRRLRTFQFADPIHEALRTDPVVYRSNVVIEHRPATDHSGRDLAHFARLLAKGHQFSARLEMMYARELMMAGKIKDFRIAAPYFESVRGDTSVSPERMRRASCVLARGAALEKDVETLLRVAAPELVGSPPSEICCALGEYYLSRQEEQAAADWFAAALSGASPELVAISAGSQPLRGLAGCLELSGDLEQAREYMQRAQQWDEENLRQGV